MRVKVALLFTVGVVWCAVSAWANPITNGGFEVLDAHGKPVDWEFVGEKVSVTTEAHTGKYALRFEREGGHNVPPETGLNREWSLGSGEQGKMLAELKGGVVFWYKLLSASPGASVSIVVIPMSARPVEDTGAPRVSYQIPLTHAGDGRWHEGKLAYDFTDNSKVKWVHVGVRLTGSPAVLIVDDMEYLERVGPLLRFEKMHFYPDANQPSRAGVFTATLANYGDTASQPVKATLTALPGLKVIPLVTFAPRPVAPQDGIVYRWRVEGALDPARLHLWGSDGVETAEESFELAPRVELLSALMRPAMVSPGQEATLLVTVWNRGTAIAHGVKVRTALPPQKGAIAFASAGLVQVPPVPPGERRTVRIPIRAGRMLGEWQLDVQMQGDPRVPETAKSTLTVTDALRKPAQHVVGMLWIRQGSDRVIGELRRGNEVVARLPHLGSVLVRLPNGSVQRLYARYEAAGIRRNMREPVVLTAGAQDRAGGRWRFTLSVEPVSDRAFKLRYQCAVNQPREVLAYEGPMLLVGEGSTGDAKSEALMPGLEWLVGDEVSSSDLDIARDHPDRRRFVPHPNKVTIPLMAVKTPRALVGLLWDMRDEWSTGYNHPQPVFAVPDRLKGTATHRMGLIAPSVPAGLSENSLVCQKPFRIGAGSDFRLSALVIVVTPESSLLRLVADWFSHFRADEPLPAPRGTDEAQVAWSMKAYTDTLWVSDSEGWLPFLGGPGIWRNPAFHADYAYDLLKAALIVPAHPEAPRWRKLAAKVLARIGAPQADDLGFEYGDALASLSFLRMRAMELIRSQSPDGSWGFDADRRDTGVFRGMDYHELGTPGAVELGTCARNAYEILRYARISGSEDAYRAGVKALKVMERFVVPRAAQVWEVPVHTPDILAAADAIDAYVEAFWYSGDRQWLEQARRWAWAGLPFVYVWNAQGKPWMRYGSIPVFGATWYQVSWFGNIVQWNGLRYAYALLKLCEADKNAPPLWKQVAIGVTRSAMYQQSPSGENLALWPDSYHTITGVRAAWDFAPRQILKNVYHLLGREEEPRTYRLATGSRLTSSAEFVRVIAGTDSLTVELRNPQGESGQLLISAVEEPRAVRVNGQTVARTEQFVRFDERTSCWRYSVEHRALTVWFAEGERVTVQVEGFRPASVPRLPAVVTRLSFEFDRDSEGWVAANNLAPLEVRDGSVHVRSTGGDPYMIRPSCRFAPDSVKQIRLRVRGRGGSGWQLYWGTLSQPDFSEARVLHFVVPMDGDWHEVELPVGEHPQWRGQTITAIRIDPGDAPNTQAEIDYIRGE